MKKNLLKIVLFSLVTNLAFGQNGTRPDTDKVIVGSKVVRTIDVLANDNAVAGKSYQLQSVYYSITSPSTFITIGISGNKTTYTAIQNLTTNDTFFYVAKDLNSGTNDTNYVVITKDNLVQDLYPGDANKDNLCNHIDILNIGIAYGKSQFIREGIYLNNDWAPVRAYDWTGSNLSSNHRFSDANGDGIVDSIGDVSTVLKNYNRFIGSTNVQYSPTGGESFNIITADTLIINSPNSTLQLKINLGTITSKISKAYGIAFTLKCDTAIANPSKINFKASKWFDDQHATLNFSKVNKSTGEIEITIVRKNGLNNDGGGELGVIDVVVEDILLITNPIFNTNFVIEKAVLIDSNYKLLPVTLPAAKPVYMKKSTSSIENTTNNKSLTYFFNSSNNLILENNKMATLDVSIYNVLGKQIVQKQMNGLQTSDINISNWSAGIYFIKTQNEIYKMMIK